MKNKIHSYHIFVLCMILGILSGCGVSQEAAEKDAENVQTILRFFHYQGEAEEAYNKVFDAYEKENPNVKIVSEFINSESYDAVLESRIAIKDYPDIIGVHPGYTQAIPLAKAGYLADLTEQECASNFSESSLKTASVEQKIYAVPTDQSYICTFYNKRIFEEYGLAVPSTWNEFLNVCQVLKNNGITPISLGYKDIWIESLIPYALAPTTIYRDNIDFEDELYAGKTTFNCEEWENTLLKVDELTNKGYVTENFLKTTYDQQLATFAHEEAGMMIMGSWAVALIQGLNPDCDFGLFITPASEDGNNWIASSVGGMLSVCEQSEQKEIAIDFLNFFLQNDEIYGQFLKDTGNLSARTDIIAECDAQLQQLTQDIQGSYCFLDINWPSGFSDDFVIGVEKIGRGEEITDVLLFLEDSWKRRISEDE